MTATARNCRIYTLVALSLVLVLFALFCFPLPGGDAEYFLPTALLYIDGAGFRNPFWPLLLHTLDPSGRSAFTGHGHLYPLLLSLAGEWRVAGFYLISTVIALCNLLLSNILLQRYILSRLSVHAQKPTSWSQCICISWFFLALSSMLILFGRPETLACFWILLLAVVWRYEFIWRTVLNASLIAALFCTAPGTAVLALLILLCMELLRARPEQRTPSEILGYGFTFFAAVLLALCVILLVSYPHPIRFWFAGFLAHCLAVLRFLQSGSGVADWIDLTAVRYYLLLNPRILGIGIVVYVIGIIFVPSLLRNAPKERFAKVLFWLLLGSIAVVSLFPLVIRPASFYYVLPFLAILLLLLLNHFFYATRPARFLIYTIFLIVSLGFLRTTVLFGVYLNQGMTFRETNDEIAAIESLYGTRLAGSTLLYLFSSAPEHLHLRRTTTHWGKLASSRRPIITFQEHSSSLNPPVIPGYFLAKNHYRSGQPSVLGLKIANTVPGYQFALHLPLFHLLPDLQACHVNKPFQEHFLDWFSYRTPLDTLQLKAGRYSSH